MLVGFYGFVLFAGYICCVTEIEFSTDWKICTERILKIAIHPQRVLIILKPSVTDIILSERVLESSVFQNAMNVAVLCSGYTLLLKKHRENLLFAHNALLLFPYWQNVFRRNFICSEFVPAFQYCSEHIVENWFAALWKIKNTKPRSERMGLITESLKLIKTKYYPYHSESTMMMMIEIGLDIDYAWMR